MEEPDCGLANDRERQTALAFAKGKQGHGCEVHVPDDIDVKAIREKISLSQSEFAKLFGLSKRTLNSRPHPPQERGCMRCFHQAFAPRPQERTGKGDSLRD